MADKEKEAIARLTICIQDKCQDICAYRKCSKACIKAIFADVDMVLNLIQTKQEEIERWKMEYNHWCQLAIDRKIELEKKDKRISDLLEEIEILKEENEDLNKSVDQIYEDYQDIGTEMFNKIEEIAKKDKLIRDSVKGINRLKKQKEEIFWKWQKQYSECKKKDKIIDFMATYIGKIDESEDLCNDDICHEGNNCNKCIIEYFTNKAEKESKDEQS